MSGEENLKNCIKVSKNIAAIYVYRFPFDVADCEIFPSERKREIESVSNPEVREQKFYVWKLLEYALLRTFGVKACNLEFKKTQGKWSCNVCEFSLSHSGEIVAVALSRKPIGIDVEEIAPEKFTEKLIDKITTDGERDGIFALQGAERGKAACRLWTAKEAAYKADGGKNFSFAKCDVTGIPQKTVTVMCGGKEYFVTVVSPDAKYAEYSLQGVILKED